MAMTMATIDRSEAFGASSPRAPVLRRNAGATPLVRVVEREALVTPTVFVVDGDSAVRAWLDRLCRAAGYRPKAFASAEEFLSCHYKAVPCCLVLDVMLPGLGGLELQMRLAERRDIPVIFISGNQDVALSVRAMKAGAMEFLTKPLDDRALLDAIQMGIERSRAVLRHDSEMRVLATRYSSLTRREREVMSLVVAGLLNKQVGGELGISEITVKAHRGHLMRKMRADSLPHLVAIATRLGLTAVRDRGANLNRRRTASSVSHLTDRPRCHATAM